MNENKNIENIAGQNYENRFQTLLLDEGNSIRVDMISEASSLADFLFNYGKIEGIGIAGSLAKGKENPSDIDLVVLIDNEKAKEYQKEKIKLMKQGLSIKSKINKYLGINNDDDYFSKMYKNNKHQVDIIIVSSNPDQEYIKMMADENIDPNFLQNISKDVYLYDYIDRGFKKEKIFNDQQIRIMEMESFRRLKELLNNLNNPIYDSIENSHNHEKRMDYLNPTIEGKYGDINDDIERKNRNELIKSFSDNPFSQEIWDNVVKLAESDLETDSDSGYPLEDLTGMDFYDHIPISSLIEVGKRLKSAETRDEKYKILMEKNRKGELWYDIILGYVNNKMFQPVVEKLDLYSRGQIIFENALDIGCGTGNTLKLISPFCHSCVGLDNSAMALDVAKNNGLPENVISLVNGDATKLPFENRSFDLIVSNGLTCYLTTEQVKKYVNEISRVLKPGGTYFETVTRIKDGEVLPGFENEYLSSNKSVLVCYLDRLCSNNNDIKKTENTITVIINQFKKLGFNIQFSDFNANDIGVLQFNKKS